MPLHVAGSLEVYPTYMFKAPLIALYIYTRLRCAIT